MVNIDRIITSVADPDLFSQFLKLKIFFFYSKIWFEKKIRRFSGPPPPIFFFLVVIYSLKKKKHHVLKIGQFRLQNDQNYKSDPDPNANNTDPQPCF